jgi:thiamine pyrophosphate-dependent acetolactate synthase large subunit-like protein
MTDDIGQLAGCLVEAGVRVAFGVAGSGASYRLISALKSRGVGYVPVSHEAVGPIAAGAYGWLIGSPAVAISIKGPGMANMMAGMCGAYLEGYAPVCIAENYDDTVSAERMHKRLDQHTIAGTIADGFYDLGDVPALPAVLAKHSRATRPVYIELSRTRSRNRIKEEAAASSPVASIDEARAVLDGRLATARNVVAIIGSLAKRREWEPLVEKLQIPVFTTVQAKGVIDESEFNAAGIYTGAGRALALESSLLPRADLVVTFGLRNMEILNPAAKQGFVNFDVAHHLATPHDVLVDESSLQELLTALSRMPRWGDDLIDQNRRDWRNYVDSHEWMPGQVFAAIDGVGWPHTLVLDTGTFCTIGEHVWHARRGRHFLGSSNGRNLGLAVPHALGAACARPGMPAICVLGDGGIRYYLAEIRTIAAMQLPVCFILMKDGRYGSIAVNVATPPDPDIVEPRGTSWCGVMQAMGLESGHAASAPAFEELLACWDRRRCCYIEASFDPEEYLHIADEIRN